MSIFNYMTNRHHALYQYVLRHLQTDVASVDGDDARIEAFYNQYLHNIGMLSKRGSRQITVALVYPMARGMTDLHHFASMWNGDEPMFNQQELDNIATLMLANSHESSLDQAMRALHDQSVVPYRCIFAFALAVVSYESDRNGRTFHSAISDIGLMQMRGTAAWQEQHAAQYGTAQPETVREPLPVQGEETVPAQPESNDDLEGSEL